MRKLLVLALLLISISFYLPAQAGVGPPLWSDDFGTELPVVSDCDDCEEAIVLPFMFPFNGSTFNMAYVGSNGCIQLGGLGLDGEIDYDHWSYMEEFLSDSDPDNPEICPFNNDLNTGEGGTIYYNNSTNPLVITWDGVSSHNAPGLLATFQILLYEDGRIVLNLNGIVVGGNLLDLDEGIVVGVTPSDLPYDDINLIIPTDPGPVDLNQGPFNFGPTAYERWCFDEADSCGVDGDDTGLPGPINTAFDLDCWSISFDPVGNGFFITGFEGETGACSSASIPTLNEWGLIAMASILGIVGFMVMRRRKVTA